VAIIEGGMLHVVENWCHYGSVSRPDEAAELTRSARPRFDVDTYKILQRMMESCEVIPVGA